MSKIKRKGINFLLNGKKWYYLCANQKKFLS
jgi:hypothetical protein